MLVHLWDRRVTWNGGTASLYIKNACNHDLFDGNIFNEAKRKLWGSLYIKNACNHDLFDGNIFNEAKRKLWGSYCRTVVGQVTWMIKVEISHFGFLSFLLRKFFVETLLADDNNSSGFYCILTKLFHYLGTNC